MDQADRARESLDVLKPEFVRVCLRDQDCFRTERQWEALLSLLPQDRGGSTLALSRWASG
jgi:DNA primase small subunit